MKSADFLNEARVDLASLSVKDVQLLQKKARKKIKDVMDSAFPFPVKSVARGGKGMQGLVFTFAADDIKQLASNSGKWKTLANAVNRAFSKQGFKTTIEEFIWTNKGDLRTKPKVLLHVDVNARLENLFFAVQGNRFFAKNETLPHGTAALIKKVRQY